jgi:hypothetical protein
MFLPSSFHPLSTFADRMAERRAILTRAAEQEARRQNARVNRDRLAEYRAEDCLQRLRFRYLQTFAVGSSAIQTCPP